MSYPLDFELIDQWGGMSIRTPLPFEKMSLHVISLRDQIIAASNHPIYAVHKMGRIQGTKHIVITAWHILEKTGCPTHPITMHCARELILDGFKTLAENSILWSGFSRIFIFRWPDRHL